MTIAVDSTTEESMSQRRLQTPQLVSTGQAAKLVGVDPSTIFRWVRNGDLDAILVGGRNVLYREDVVALARKRGGAALSFFSDDVVAEAWDVTFEVEPTSDPLTYRLVYSLPTGETLVGACQFPEVPSEWLDRVSQEHTEEDDNKK